MQPFHPLEYLAHTNRAPTEEEQGQLQTLVADYDEKVNALSEKIAQLEEALQRFNREKTILTASVAPFKRALSPLRRLPEDVLREIFVGCIDGDINPTMSNTEAPVLLTQITSGMRRIALATPALWAAIHIPMIGSAPPEAMDTAQSIMEKRTAGVKEWLLRRSGGLPLRISVRESQGYKTPAHHLGKVIVNVIFACRARWRDVMFTMAPDIVRSRLRALKPADAPNLRSLYLSFGSGAWAECVLLGAPGLRRFGAVVNEHYGIPDLPVNWANLTDLALPSLVSFPHTLTSLASILRQCTRLVSLRITVSKTGPDVIDDIYLPRLRILEVEELPGASTSPGIVDAIHAPALESVMYSKNTPVDARCTALLALLARAPRVTQLSMGHCASPAMLRACLVRCPRLTVLALGAGGSHVRETHADDALLAQFGRAEGAGAPCPHLAYFRCRAVLAVSVECLRAFVLGKADVVPGQARWRTLWMQVQCAEEDRRGVDAVVAEGTAAGIRLELAFYSRPQRVLWVFSQGGRVLAERDASWPSVETWPMEG